MTLASVMIGVPSAPNATGAVFAKQRKPGGVERREAGADHQRRRDGDRRAEAGGPFDERAEAEGDQQRLDATIGRQRGDRGFDLFELARLDRERVQEHGREHDPADREQAKARPYTAAATAVCHGMPKTPIATASAVIKPAAAAFGADQPNRPSVPSRTVIGAAASKTESHSEPVGL